MGPSPTLDAELQTKLAERSALNGYLSLGFANTALRGCPDDPELRKTAATIGKRLTPPFVLTIQRQIDFTEEEGGSRVVITLQGSVEPVWSVIPGVLNAAKMSFERFTSTGTGATAADALESAEQALRQTQDG